jgi:signal transduction histidine kinase
VLKHRLERLVPAVLRALREAEARAERSRAEGSLRFLADASIVLAESLDYLTTLGRIAELAITALADWCVIDMIEDDRSIRRLVVAHSDPSRSEAARALKDQVRPDPAGPTPMAEVLRTRRPKMIPEFTDAMLEAIVPRTEHRSIVRSLGPQSLMVVPLVTRGQVLGAIALASTDGTRRRYGPGDLALAEELARRAAVAIENARLHRATQDACRVAEAASRAKDRFLAMLSHELRTPLTPVLLAINAFLDEPEMPDPFRPQLEMIRRNVELEASLIEDLLDVTRIVQGKLILKREVVEVHSLVRQALAICRAEVAAAGIHLELSLEATETHVDGDPARLQQVFWDLIKNAVKFTPTGGTIMLRTRNEPSREPGGRPRLVVVVSDTGIGIAPEVLPKIFDAFEQGGDSVTHRFGGLSLGPGDQPLDHRAARRVDLGRECRPGPGRHLHDRAGHRPRAASPTRRRLDGERRVLAPAHAPPPVHRGQRGHSQGHGPAPHPERPRRDDRI